MHVRRRLAGLLLLAGAYVPFHRLLVPARAGPAGSAAREAAEAAWTLSVSGTVIVLAFAWVCTRMVPERAEGSGVLAWMERTASAPSSATFALLVAGAATVLSGFVSLVVFGGDPTSVDEMAQLFNARAIAAGRGAIPLEGAAAAFVIQNGVVTPSGWVSVYPPLHTSLLALGVVLGVPWAIGPIATGVASGAATWTVERLQGRATGRVAGLLLLASPFWILVGATYLSHTTAAAGLALLAMTVVRARAGGLAWYALAGGAAGIAVSARPWIGLACGAAIAVAALAPEAERSAPEPPPGDARASDRERGTVSRWAARATAVLAGGLPFALLLGLWNLRYFGNPLRLGYSSAFGPAHGLGLHVDPWGNRYELVEALGYSGADLTQLGIRLFESPLPAIAVVGVFLVVRPLAHGSRVFLAWAVAAVVANALYWHHGTHFGPRMLFESLPAWVALFASTVTRTFGGSSGGSRGGVRFARWALGVAIVAGLALAPGTLFLPRDFGSVATPDPPTSDAIVFVHGTWSSRIASRLAAVGMRRDSIETALRRNDICAVHRYARWRTDENDEPQPDDPYRFLDFTPRPGTPGHLEARTLSPGNRVRIDPSIPLDASCRREARSDRLGVVELELLAWRLPPLGSGGVMVARDMGPGQNLGLLQTLGRPAYVYVDLGGDAGTILLDYTEGMELLWGGAAGDNPSR